MSIIYGTLCFLICWTLAAYDLNIFVCKACGLDEWEDGKYLASGILFLGLALLHLTLILAKRIALYARRKTD